MIALTLPASPLAAATARRLVAATLSDLGCPRELVGRAVLVGSELVTNAVQHGIGRPRLRLLTRPDRVRLEVYDGSATLPKLRNAAGVPSWRPHGRGLAIVSDQADRWGIELDGTGKWVWAEFRRQHGRATGAVAREVA